MGIISPYFDSEKFHLQSRDPQEAVAAIREIYDTNKAYLTKVYQQAVKGNIPGDIVTVGYPEIRVEIKERPRFKKSPDEAGDAIDGRQAYGYAAIPGIYHISVTAPDVFEGYWTSQLENLLRNHNKASIAITASKDRMPLQYAIGEDPDLDPAIEQYFYQAQIANIDESIRLGDYSSFAQGHYPLGWYNAERTDYSLHNLRHYTGTDPKEFQPFIIFSNYQMFLEEFVVYALKSFSGEFNKAAEPRREHYTRLVTPGGKVFTKKDIEERGFDKVFNEAMAGYFGKGRNSKKYQMSAFHLHADDGKGITMMDIGVGPSNAMTAMSHLAVLRPKVVYMLGHCGGLDSNLPNGSVIQATRLYIDHDVMKGFLPKDYPIIPTSEIHQVTANVVKNLYNFESDYDAKTKMRSGLVVDTAQRVWELLPQKEIERRFGAYNPIAIQMEGGVVEGMGDFHGTPHGAVYFVTDNMHKGNKGVAKAHDEYLRKKERQALVPIKVMEELAGMPTYSYHSRQLRNTLRPVPIFR